MECSTLFLEYCASLSLENVLKLYIQKYKEMVETKKPPEPSRGRKCVKCPYREICEKEGSQ